MTSSANRAGLGSSALPLIGATAAAMRGEVALRLSVCLVAAVVLLPVWWPLTKELRFVRAALGLGVGACVLGAGLSAYDSQRTLDAALMRAETGTMLGLVAAVGMLAWARATVGAPRTLIAFGVGGLLNVGLIGVPGDNPWKYALAVPVTILVLGLLAGLRSRVPVLVALLGLAGVSAGSDSRSFTAFLGVTLALTAWQARPSTPGRARPWLTVVGVGALVVAGFYLAQALVLDGALGAAAQQRSQAQLDASGSLVSGGRPELRASVALLREQPWGYGSGTVPTPTDIYVAKTGMSQVNYDPDNGYVDVYMFGGHYEVHSVLGDVWIRFGVLGAAMLTLMVVVALVGSARAIAANTASAALVLVAALGTWDFLFSPFLTSYPTLALWFALAVPAAVVRGHRVEGGRSTALHPGGVTAPR